MTTQQRVAKVHTQYQNGFITLPELCEELTEIDYLSTQQNPSHRYRLDPEMV